MKFVIIRFFWCFDKKPVINTSQTKSTFILFYDT